jgi:hypothetical protein
VTLSLIISPDTRFPVNSSDNRSVNRSPSCTSRNIELSRTAFHFARYSVPDVDLQPVSPCSTRAHLVCVICFSFVLFAVDRGAGILPESETRRAITLQPRAHRSSCCPPLLPVAKLYAPHYLYQTPPPQSRRPFPSFLFLVCHLIPLSGKLCRICSLPHIPKTLVRVDMSIRTFPGLLPHGRSHIPSLIRTKTTPPTQ